MNNNLTDISFWKEYWKNYQYEKAPQRTFFDKYLPASLTEGNGKSFIEIGGFPGTMSIYFYKKFNCKVSLLDFYIDKAIVHEMEVINEIPEESISCIESDFFSYTSNCLYDFVFSLGFIEHFDNTVDVISRHIDLLAPNGNLLIILPNFLGLNGWIQQRFDRENFEAHNLNSMRLNNLKQLMSRFDLNNVKVEYTAKPIVWLEPKPTTPKTIRIFVKLLSYAIKLIPIRGKLLSPYIVISAQKTDKV